MVVEHSINDNNATLNIDYAPLARKNGTEVSIVIECEFKTSTPNRKLRS
jgi:hypothetical protein